MAAPPTAVWAVLSDFHAVDTWAPRITRVVATDAPGPGLGMGRRCDIRGLGSVDEVVNVWEAGRRLGYSVSPLGPIGVSQSLWEIEPVGTDSSKVTLRLDYDMRFGAFGTLVHAFPVRRLLAKNLSGALALLKRRVEAGTRVGPRRTRSE